MILETIVENKKREIRRLKEERPLPVLKASLGSIAPPRDFKTALTGRDCSIIAEVKMRSPSKGLIREDFDPVGISSLYEKKGAAAISVLTDEQFFGGKSSYLTDIKRAVGIPVLRKDFIIDPYQIYETKSLGGDAVLLITRILDETMLVHCINLAESLGLSPLVEVHSRGDLDKAAAAGAGIIGINNRNLQTFATDLRNSLDLAPFIPENTVVVSESGIRTRDDIEILMKEGVHAFLVGEALMKAEDVGAKLEELLGKGGEKQ
ncbi:MAG: indole-3-glycerol phosphate synthase TrpC [Deltaproteobacteria bacterium]|nr:indole-3-glycerol phosphate synthase TrpC [Deltaproteobacteria bacterium]